MRTFFVPWKWLIPIAACVTAVLAWVSLALPPQRVSEQTLVPAGRPEKKGVRSETVARKARSLPALSEIPANEAPQLQENIVTLLATEEFEDRQRALGSELRELIQANPQAASTLAESQKAGATRDEMVARVARIWAEDDPDRAWQWASGLADRDECERALGEVALQIADEEPDRATKIAATAGLNQVLEALVQRWAMNDLEAARDWVSVQPAGAAREMLMQGLAMAVAEVSFDDAASLVAEELPPGKAQEEAAMAVLHHWAQDDPVEARRWVEIFPEGPLRNRALHELNSTPTNR